MHSSYATNHLWFIYVNVSTHQSLLRLITLCVRNKVTHIQHFHQAVYSIWYIECSSIFYLNSNNKTRCTNIITPQGNQKLFVLAVSVRGFGINSSERQHRGYQMTAVILLREFPVNWLLMSFLQKQLDISHARHKKLGIMPHWFSATIRSHYIFW